MVSPPGVTPCAANFPSCDTSTATNGFFAFRIPAACLAKTSLMGSSNGVPLTGALPSVKRKTVSAPESFASSATAARGLSKLAFFLLKGRELRNRCICLAVSLARRGSHSWAGNAFVSSPSSKVQRFQALPMRMRPPMPLKINLETVSSVTAFWRDIVDEVSMRNR